jgi:hypothetical protein
MQPSLIRVSILESFSTRRLTIVSTVAHAGTFVLETGPEHDQNHVHIALLTHHSEYFYNALRDPWEEAHEGVVSLDDIETVTRESSTYVVEE